jgi:hypothetical protein
MHRKMSSASMALPAVLRESLRAVAFSSELRLQPTAAEATRELTNYVRRKQQKDNWCWAAVGTSVATFYDERTPWHEQCS